MTSHTRTLAAIAACAVALASCSLFPSSGEATVTTVARLAYPNVITNDGEYLYVAVSGSIEQINLSDYTVTNSYTIREREGAPWGICIDGSNLYYNEGSTTTVKLVMATGEITTLHHWGYPAAAGLATDGVNLYTVCGNAIYKMSLHSEEWTSAAVIREYVQWKNCYENCLCSDGTNLYIATCPSCMIYKARPATGETHVLAGQWAVSKRKDGCGVSATFASPRGIATDGTSLYIADGSAIRRLILSTGEVTTIAGRDIRGFRDGPGTWARFNTPMGITYFDGSLYVSDQMNNAIRRVQLP